MKLFLSEAGSAEMSRAAEGFEQIAACAVAYVEIYAGLARALRMARITPTQHGALVAEIEPFWRRIAHVAVDDSLLRLAANHAQRFGLRAYDAMHLAALETAGPPGTITFACWDHDLRGAAAQIGYDLLPQQA